MNALQKALANIHYIIPREILEETFMKNDNVYRGEEISLDDRIMNAIIRPRVFVDTNIVGGNLIFIYIGDRRFH